MIDSAALLKDLKKQLKLLIQDLRERAEDPDNAWGQRLNTQYQAAYDRKRTAYSWVQWRDGEVDQAAVAWIIATTFIRFCEDNHLLEGARDEQGFPVVTQWIAGPSGGTARATENQTEYFRTHPTANRRDWLRVAFKVLADQPATRGLVDQMENPVWFADISAEAASQLVDFWRETDVRGAVVHNFEDPDFSTRFLGDLYQDLSEYARKNYALLQTPRYVEQFLLRRTLSPAVAEFGLANIRIIDPSCGSGHFLLGAFEYLLARWAETAPGLPIDERVRRSLAAIHGVDINPFAVSIAEFRLAIATIKALGLSSLTQSFVMPVHLAVGDSLMGATLTDENRGDMSLDETDGEALHRLQKILKSNYYHAVVGNPPYITVKDAAMSGYYRANYEYCSGKYALSVPFMQIFFSLAIQGTAGRPAGYVGQITSNSFTKREFGRRLAAVFLAGMDSKYPVDLTDLIDTSGIQFPGHSTPTIILIGRPRRPQLPNVSAVVSLRGEVAAPTDGMPGAAWQEVERQYEQGTFRGEWTVATDLSRRFLADHPWSLGGSSVNNLMDTLREESTPVKAWLSALGYSSITGDDEFLIAPTHVAARLADPITPYVIGEEVRDYQFRAENACLIPLSPEGSPREPSPALYKRLWPGRTVLANRLYFGERPEDRGMRWFDYAIYFAERSSAKPKIAYSNIATHNHFCVDRSQAVFNSHGQVMVAKRPEDTSGLAAVLNSSIAGFWLHQTCLGKPLQGEEWQRRYEYDNTKVSRVPIPTSLPSRRAQVLIELADQKRETSPFAAIERYLDGKVSNLSLELRSCRLSWEFLERRMIFEQEELDWDVYRLFGILDDGVTYEGLGTNELQLGQRTFEISLARGVMAGSKETSWFARHGATPTANVSEAWDPAYRAVVERRLELMGSDPYINLLERPEYKRRWAGVDWEGRLREALKEAILGCLESPNYWYDSSGFAQLKSVSQLADYARRDSRLQELISAMVGSNDYELTDVLMALLAEEGVPYLAAHRFKEVGLEKYRTWQEVWALQRREDAGESLDVPIPPKYGQSDFRKQSVWSRRGKLDVPKERFTNYPELGRPGDRTPVLGWAGWDHATQAQALARELGEQLASGAGTEILTPLTAGLVELEPWLHQWHRDIDPHFGSSPAEAITGLIDQVLHQLGTTRAEVDEWRPPAPTRGRRART